MAGNRGIRLGKSRRIKIGSKVIRILKWVIHRKKKTESHYKLLDSSSKTHSNNNSNNNNKAISRLCKLGQSIKRCAKENLCFIKKRRKYIRVGQSPDEQAKRIDVPKGHLAVYVGGAEGDKEDESRRVLIPVIYLNHPLFGQLLKEAEEVYGFDHPGRIMLPCPISEFEYVKTEIAATDESKGCTSWMVKAPFHHHHHQQGFKYITL